MSKDTAITVWLIKDSRTGYLAGFDRVFWLEEEAKEYAERFSKVTFGIGGKYKPVAYRLASRSGDGARDCLRASTEGRVMKKTETRYVVERRDQFGGWTTTFNSRVDLERARSVRDRLKEDVPGRYRIVRVTTTREVVR